MKMKKVEWMAPLVFAAHHTSLSLFITPFEWPKPFTNIMLFHPVWHHASRTLGEKGEYKVKLCQTFFCVWTSMTWTREQIQVTERAHLKDYYILTKR